MHEKIISINGNPDRYIDLDIPGWSDLRDLLLLATIAQMMPDNTTFVEAGCYQGRSSYAIGMNLAPNCVLHGVDVWSTELPYFDVSSQLKQFSAGTTKGSLRNMHRAARLASKHNSWYPSWALSTQDCDAMPFIMSIVDYTIPSDVSAVFIDGNHSFDSVVSDISKFNAKKDVLLIGDDFNCGWHDVVRAVGTIKEDTGCSLISLTNSSTWFLWPNEGYWKDLLPAFLASAQRDHTALFHK